jgi:hypothetical protein
MAKSGSKILEPLKINVDIAESWKMFKEMVAGCADICDKDMQSFNVEIRFNRLAGTVIDGNSQLNRPTTVRERHLIFQVYEKLAV